MIFIIVISHRTARICKPEPDRLDRNPPRAPATLHTTKYVESHKQLARLCGVQLVELSSVVRQIADPSAVTWHPKVGMPRGSCRNGGSPTAPAGRSAPAGPRNS